MAHSDSEWHSYLLVPAHFDPATELPQENGATERADADPSVRGVALCRAGAGMLAPAHALGPAGPRALARFGPNSGLHG